MTDDLPTTSSATSAAPREAAVSGPVDSDSVTALSGTPGTMKPARLVAAICVTGLLLTGLATWAVARTDTNTEERLLQTQTRQAAAVLSTAILNVQQPMAAALEAEKVVGRTQRARAFDGVFGADVGPEALFVSASLWQRRGDSFSRVAAIGPARGLSPQGAEVQELLARAGSSSTSVVRRRTGRRSCRCPSAHLSARGRAPTTPRPSPCRTGRR